MRQVVGPDLNVCVFICIAYVKDFVSFLLSVTFFYISFVSSYAFILFLFIKVVNVYIIFRDFSQQYTLFYISFIFPFVLFVKYDGVISLQNLLPNFSKIFIAFPIAFLYNLKKQQK